MSEALPPGAKLPGRFVVESVLGSGRIATVYLAHAEDDDARRATAFVLNEVLAPDLGAWFEDAAILARTMDHPGLPVTLAVGHTDDDLPVYLTELLDGESLQLVLQRHPGGLPLPEVTRLTRELASVLDYLHGRSPPVVHRALAPSNIFLATPGQRVKLLETGPTDRPRAATPRPPWRAPEELAGIEHITPRADVFVLASLVYEMLTARTAFPGDEGAALDAMRADARPCANVVRADLPPEVDAALHRAWSLSPGLRPASAGELFAALVPHLSAPARSGPLSRPAAPRAAPRTPPPRASGSPPLAPSSTSQPPPRRPLRPLGLRPVVAPPPPSTPPSGPSVGPSPEGLSEPELQAALRAPTVPDNAERPALSEPPDPGPDTAPVALSQGPAPVAPLSDRPPDDDPTPVVLAPPPRPRPAPPKPEVPRSERSSPAIEAPPPTPLNTEPETAPAATPATPPVAPAPVAPPVSQSVPADLPAPVPSPRVSPPAPPQVTQPTAPVAPPSPQVVPPSPQVAPPSPQVAVPSAPSPVPSPPQPAPTAPVAQGASAVRPSPPASQQHPLPPGAWPLVTQATAPSPSPSPALPHASHAPAVAPPPEDEPAPERPRRPFTDEPTQEFTIRPASQGRFPPTLVAIWLLANAIVIAAIALALAWVNTRHLEAARQATPTLCAPCPACTRVEALPTPPAPPSANPLELQANEPAPPEGSPPHSPTVAPTAPRANVATRQPPSAPRTRLMPTPARPTGQRSRIIQSVPVFGPR